MENFTQKASFESEDHQEEIKVLDNIEDIPNILKLPQKMREESLRKIKEKLVEKQLRISMLQVGIFDYIKDNHEKGTLDHDSLTNHIDELFDDPIFTKEDRGIAEEILLHFNDKYSAIKMKSEDGDDSLLENFSDGRLSPTKLQGDYKIIRNALSFDFVFEKQDDFELFINDKYTKRGTHKKGSINGLSYFYNSIPITASSENSEETLKHEIQHKEFGTINIDKILSDSKIERSTRDEILSFYIEGGVGNESSFEFINYILINNYKFHKEDDISEEEYSKMITKAVEAIINLEKIFSSKDVIINLLRREPLSNWNRIAKRITESKDIASSMSLSEGLSIREQREIFKEKKDSEDLIRRESFLKRQKEYADKERDRFLKPIKELLSSPLVFQRHSNSNGVFYAKIDKKNIVSLIRKKIDSFNSYKIKEKNIIIDLDINTYGDYMFSVIFEEDKIDGLIKVEKFK